MKTFKQILSEAETTPQSANAAFSNAMRDIVDGTVLHTMPLTQPLIDLALKNLAREIDFQSDIPFRFGKVVSVQKAMYGVVVEVEIFTGNLSGTVKINLSATIDSMGAETIKWR